MTRNTQLQLWETQLKCNLNFKFICNFFFLLISKKKELRTSKLTKVPSRLDCFLLQQQQTKNFYISLLTLSYSESWGNVSHTHRQIISKESCEWNRKFCPSIATVSKIEEIDRSLLGHLCEKKVCVCCLLIII